jgi:hypothetical protein
MHFRVAGFPVVFRQRSIGPIASWLPIASFVAAAVLLFHNFDFGFRATADQREYTYWAMTLSPLDCFKKGMDLASNIFGRIGTYFTFPLHVFGGWIGDMWFYPFLCIGVFATIFVSFYAWIQFVSESKVALALSAVYLALLPVGLHHWLPNAYPTLFFPLAVGLLCRITFQSFYGSPQFGVLSKGALALGIFAGAVSFELSFILLLTMAAFEAFVHFFNQKSPSNRISAGYLVWQGSIVAAAFVSYLLYRFLNPSIYSGNQLPINVRFDQAKVTLLHLYHAMSIESIWMANWGDLLSSRLRVAEAVVVLFGLSTVIATSRFERTHWQSFVVLGCVIAILTTVPIAANHNYIGWCLRGGECTYLDARFSLIGLTLAFFYAAFGLLPKHIFRTGFAALVGLIGAMTFLVNASVRTDLRSVSAADSAAKAYVCKVGEQTGGDAELIKQLMTLDKAPSPATFHPFYDDAYKVTYWERYLEHLRHSPFWLCP